MSRRKLAQDSSLQAQDSSPQFRTVLAGRVPYPFDVKRLLRAQARPARDPGGNRDLLGRLAEQVGGAER